MLPGLDDQATEPTTTASIASGMQITEVNTF